MLVLGDESHHTRDLIVALSEVGTGVDLLVGALRASLQDRIRTAVPVATTFISGLEWLHGEPAADDDATVGRLLLVDRSSMHVSSILPDTTEEKAIFGEGFGNGLVVIARRLMAGGC